MRASDWMIVMSENKIINNSISIFSFIDECPGRALHFYSMKYKKI